jgi:putative molybdenum carrier protein
MTLSIWSGAQTGVDRAALDFAIEAGIPHGGWVPRGRRAEDGRVPDKYLVKESLSPGYPPRTEANVRDTDATLIFTTGSIQNEPGCLLTASIAMKLKKPYVVVDLAGDEESAAQAVEQFFTANAISVLNVAGPRGSRNPDVDKVKRILLRGVSKGVL